MSSFRNNMHDLCLLQQQFKNDMHTLHLLQQRLRNILSTRDAWTWDKSVEKSKVLMEIRTIYDKYNLQCMYDCDCCSNK